MSINRFRPGILVSLVLVAATASAHESRPAYLQLSLDDSETVIMSFKAPAVGNMRMSLYPNMPMNCTEMRQFSKYIIDGAYTESGEFNCAGGLTGETVSVWATCA